MEAQKENQQTKEKFQEVQNQLTQVLWGRYSRANTPPVLTLFHVSVLQLQSQLAQSQTQSQNQLTQSQKEVQQAKAHSQQVSAVPQVVCLHGHSSSPILLPPKPQLQNQLKSSQSQAQARQNQVQQVQRELQQAKDALQQNLASQKELQQTGQQEVTKLKAALSQSESRVRRSARLRFRPSEPLLS